MVCVPSNDVLLCSTQPPHTIRVFPNPLDFYCTSRQRLIGFVPTLVSFIEDYMVTCIFSQFVEDSKYPSLSNSRSWSPDQCEGYPVFPFVKFIYGQI